MYRVNGGPAESSALADMPVGSPAYAAWTAAGQPTSELFADVVGEWCGCCGAGNLPLRAAYRVVSRKFTDADCWPYGSDWLCVVCAWAYTTPALRRSVYRVHQQPAEQVPRRRCELGAELAVGALAAETTVVLPVRGRRHILPTAQWGHVCTDDVCVRWDETAAALLRTLRWLRTQPGVRARDLESSTPPIQVLRAAGGERITVWKRWELLEPWREQSDTWWDAAIALSTIGQI